MSQEVAMEMRVAQADSNITHWVLEAVQSNPPKSSAARVTFKYEIEPQFIATCPT